MPPQTAALRFISVKYQFCQRQTEKCSIKTLQFRTGGIKGSCADCFCFYCWSLSDFILVHCSAWRCMGLCLYGVWCLALFCCSSAESEELAVHLYPGAVTVQGVLRRKTVLKEGKKPTVRTCRYAYLNQEHAVCNRVLFIFKNLIQKHLGSVEWVQEEYDLLNASAPCATLWKYIRCFFLVLHVCYT